MAQFHNKMKNQDNTVTNHSCTNRKQSDDFCQSLIIYKQYICYNQFMEIFPSILEKEAQNYIVQISKLSPYFNHFQIDIADGIFVPNKTAQIDEIAELLNRYTDKNISFEFHLMIKDFETEIKKLKKLINFLNITTVLIHASLSPNYQQLTTNYPDFSFGLVLNPEDSVEQLLKLFKPLNLQTLPLVQIMSVNPGYQGNPFLPETLRKIEQLRQANYRNKISLDGAVSDRTIPLILAQKYRPDILCPGSFLTRANDLNKRVNYLKRLLR